MLFRTWIAKWKKKENWIKQAYFSITFEVFKTFFVNLACNTPIWWKNTKFKKKKNNNIMKEKIKSNWKLNYLMLQCILNMCTSPHTRPMVVMTKWAWVATALLRRRQNITIWWRWCVRTAIYTRRTWWQSSRSMSCSSRCRIWRWERGSGWNSI